MAAYSNCDTGIFSQSSCSRTRNIDRLSEQNAYCVNVWATHDVHTHVSWSLGESRGWIARVGEAVMVFY